MKAHSSDGALQCHGALTLTYLVQACPEAQSAAVGAGAVEGLVSAMRAFGADAEELQASCAVALAALAQQCRTGAERVCKAGGVEVLVDSLRQPLSEDADGDRLQRCCECLAVLVSSLEGDLPVSWHAAAEAVTGAMLLLPSATEVQSAGCWALEEVARKGAADGSEGVCEAGGLSAVASAMNRHRTAHAVLDAGCKTLRVVAIAKGASSFVREAVQAAALACRAAMTRSSKAPKAAARSLRLACSALEAWAARGPGDAAEAGGTDALLSSMASQPTDLELLKSCLRALGCIGGCAPGLQALRQAGCLDAVQKAVDATSSEEGAGLLRALRAPAADDPSSI